MIPRRIVVEVVYALPQRQTIRSVCLDSGSTAMDAVRASGILGEFPEIDPASNQIGIFGKPAGPGTILAEADRVEIYRPLRADPKEVRRKRAGKARARRINCTTG